MESHAKREGSGRRARQWDRADLTAQLAKIDYHTGGWGQRGVEPFGGGGRVCRGKTWTCMQTKS